MPYRIDLRRAGDAALDRLVELGAIDAEMSSGGGIAALMPDGTPPERVAAALGIDDYSVAPAIGRDDGSVWILTPRSRRIGRLHIDPAHADPEPGAIRLIDGAAFGTGLHPTTALCLEALQEIVATGEGSAEAVARRPPAAGAPESPSTMLDVGTGSGVLALAALRLGVARSVGIDIDPEALRVAAENARLNGLEPRLRLIRGAPEAVLGTWPLVVANVLAAPLMDMAPALVRRLAHQGRLLLSGIPAGVQHDVDRTYRRLGLRHVEVTSRSGWVALQMQASW